MANETAGPRVYTDERLPGFEVHNHGDIRFFVYQDGEEVDSFTAYERAGDYTVTEPFSQRRAKAYFDRMVSGSMSSEMAAREGGSEVKITDLTSRMNWKPRVPGEQLGNPLSGMREMTQDDVDQLIAQARAETDPAKAQALRQQVLSVLAQQESAAQRVARFLLSL